MSHPSTQSAFFAPPSITSRRRSFAQSTAPTADHASAYRAAHGPRLTLPYQSSYQRDYAAVEEYMKLKREKEKRQAEHAAENSEEEDGRVWSSSHSSHSSQTDREEDSGQMSESELKADSESVLDEAVEREADEDEDDEEEAVGELRASSTFVPYNHSPPQESEQRSAASSAPYSHSHSHSPSYSPSPSAGSSARSLQSSHSARRSRHSVSSLPIDAWQQRTAQRQLEDSDTATEADERALEDERADRRDGMRREDDPAIQRLRTSLRASRLADLPPPSSPLSSKSAFNSSSAHSSQPSSPPRAATRRLVGDRDSDWRPSRRIIHPHNQPSEPTALRYTPLASYPVSAAASLPSSIGDSGSSSPIRSADSNTRRLRSEVSRIDPSSVPYAAGMPSHRRGASSPYGSDSVASALSTLPSSAAGTPLLSSSLQSSRSSTPLSHTPQLHSGDTVGRKEKVQRGSAAERLEGRGGEEDKRDGRGFGVVEQQADSRRQRGSIDSDREEADSRQWGDRTSMRDELDRGAGEGKEAVRRRHVAEEHMQQQQRGQLNLPTDGRRKQRTPVRDEQLHTDDRRIRHTAAAVIKAAKLAPHYTAKAPHTRRSLLPDSTSSSATPSYPPLAAARSAHTALTGYGYSDMTPGSIERRKERERQEYELDLKRIREDQSNIMARAALRERNYTGLQPL